MAATEEDWVREGVAARSAVSRRAVGVYMMAGMRVETGNWRLWESFGQSSIEEGSMPGDRRLLQ